MISRRPCRASPVGWSALLKREWLPLLVALVGGVLLHSMNVLMLATVLPSIVEEVGGTAMMSWPTTAFLASSIVAATCTGHLTAQLGARSAFLCRRPGVRRRRADLRRWRRRWESWSPAASCRASAAACCRRWPMCWSASRFPSRCGRASPPCCRALEHVGAGRSAGGRRLRDLGQLARLLLCRDRSRGPAGDRRGARPATCRGATTGRSGRAMPVGRIVLICLAIAVMSAASVVACRPPRRASS